jgi:hypothetical protein
MMSIHCPRHGRPGHILGIEGQGRDLTVRWVCACGHQGTHRPQRAIAAA